jgi:DNA-binding GntR family transcriptional regulator
MPNRSAASVIPVTRAGAVAEELRRMIQTGELPGGTHLRQAAVAKQFRVSTTPVREAFARLARDGLVRQDSHRGVVVFAPSVKELSEIYDIRSTLEPLAIELAAAAITAAELEGLNVVMAAMRTAEPEGYARLNREFHSRIYAAARRPRLAEMIQSLCDASDAYLRMTVRLRDDEYGRRAHGEHEEILSALREQAPKRAARVLARHLRHTADHVTGLIVHHEA